VSEAKVVKSISCSVKFSNNQKKNIHMSSSLESIITYMQ
jgi:hypothetical protein